MKKIILLAVMLVALAVQSAFAVSSSNYLLLSKWLLGYYVNPSATYGQVSTAWKGIYIGNKNPGVEYPVTLKTVYAVCDGEVINSLGGFSGLIAIYNAKVDKTFIYTHLNSRHVYISDTVQAGQVIGLSGRVAPYSMPYLLHFEVRNGRSLYASKEFSDAVEPFYWSQQARSPLPTMEAP